MRKAKSEKNKPVDLIVPQMGEGLQEVNIIRFLKQPGDWINEDEVIYEMETDKSTVEVEAAHAGTLIEWLAAEGDTIAVGAILGRLATSSDSADAVEIDSQSDQLEPIAGEPKTNSAASRQFTAIPPRTRAYGKELGISPEEMLQIPMAGQKLMPIDIDNYLQAKTKQPKKSTGDHHDVELSKQQQLLIQRFKRSQQHIIPATLVSLLDIDRLNAGARVLIDGMAAFKEAVFISEFQVFAYVVARVCSLFPKFRSAFIQEHKIREYNHVNLGIAVQTQTNDLVIAVIPAADTLSFPEFIDSLQQQIQLAVQGTDQAKQSPHVLLSYMGNTGIISGAPILVEPAIAILFLGTSYRQEGKLTANLSLTFDHRLINGMDAAAFLQAISEEVRSLTAVQTSVDVDKVPGKQPENALSLPTVKEWLLASLGALLNVSIEAIDLDESLGLQGMDSIKAVMLTQALEEYFKVDFPATLLWHYPTCAALLQYVSERFNLSCEEVQQEARMEVDELAQALKDLSPAELNELLSEEDN